MKKLLCFILLSLLVFSVSLSSHLFATTRGIRITAKSGESLYLYKDYYALVVGVSDYDKWPDLPNAVKDAEEISRILKRLGFTVKLVPNPNSAELKKVFNDMAYGYGREENRALLFYYAGHGETEFLADGTKLGYIIPRDCPLLRDDPQGFVTRAISMKDIESYSLRIRSKHVLMIFDCCFSGAIFSLSRAVPEDITEKSSLPARQYITAGTEDETVPDRSMFKRCLLLGLKGDADLTRDGYITGTELGLYLSDKVVQATNRAQHPQYGKIRTPELARGDFIFDLSKAQAAEGPSSLSALEAERQRVAKERARLEAEQKRLAAEQRRLEEERKLAEERKRLVKEQAKLKAQQKSLKQESQRLEQTQQEELAILWDQASPLPGIIYDSRTGLEWYVGPDKATNWNEAKSWVENLTVGGGGWRMPTWKEVRGLYKKGVGTRNMDPAFDTYGWIVWVASDYDVKGGCYFGTGSWWEADNAEQGRAFAVRSRR